MNSQYGEAEFLLNYFGFKNNGFLIDIGAADGKNNSNSYDLIQCGWSGILVEPNLSNFNKLKSIHSGNPRVVLINAAAGDKTVNDSIIYCDRNDEHEQLSTLSLEQANRCKEHFKCAFVEQTVSVIKTSEIINRDYIDFVSIDTEGWDHLVVRGIDFARTSINLFCIEHTNAELLNILYSNAFREIHRTIGNIFFESQSNKL